MKDSKGEGEGLGLRESSMSQCKGAIGSDEAQQKSGQPKEGNADTHSYRSRWIHIMPCLTRATERRDNSGSRRVEKECKRPMARAQGGTGSMQKCW